MTARGCRRGVSPLYAADVICIRLLYIAVRLHCGSPAFILHRSLRYTMLHWSIVTACLGTADRRRVHWKSPRRRARRGKNAEAFLNLKKVSRQNAEKHAIIKSDTFCHGIRYGFLALMFGFDRCRGYNGGNSQVQWIMGFLQKTGSISGNTIYRR